MNMTEARAFSSTQLLVSSGFIFVNLQGEAPTIGFLRRLQPEIHHGPQMPLTMATVGGMFQPLMNADENGALNAEGFIGRPLTPFENAQMHAKNKLGILMNPELGSIPRWDVISHPYYYGEKTPDTRNVGLVMRQVYQINFCDELKEGLEKVNKNKPRTEQGELLWLTKEQFRIALRGNHSLKDGEISYLLVLYAGLKDLANNPLFAKVSVN